MAPELPEAATKLRAVLDYLPCEACLAQPTADQDLLCSVCARTSRQVAVRVSARTTVVLERPSAPEPIVIPPAVPAPEPAAREISVRFADEPSAAKPGVVEVVVEPLAAPAAVPVPIPLEDEAPAFSIVDLVDYTPARDEFFDYRHAPAPAVAPAKAEEPPQDDFVFRAPPEPVPEPAPEPVPEPEPEPVEEIPVEPEQEPNRWAPPSDFLAEEAEAEAEPAPPPQPSPPEEEVVEMEPVEDEPVEMEVVPDEEVVEMGIVADEPPAPPAPGATDLYRLRGFESAHEQALAGAHITEVSHLSGHDAGELATRTGLPFEKLVAWVQVADLVQEVGVPLDAANALVAAGVQGPRGLREGNEADVAERASAFGGYAVTEREVRRWKRRA